MATRVFLLSADEKAVHVITQILDEQDIRFEHSSDPTFTLKRLVGQHFDVLVVDCDNAESAMQVFNSARASSLNKGSIAIAIVEGKAGVPNAFRLGASLVLTKPVSLDQARNTLRTAVGMTKKDATEARPVVVAATPVPPPVHAPVPVPPPTPAPIPAAVVSALPTPVLPVASAPSVVSPISAAAPPAPAPLAIAPQPLTPRIPEPAAPAKTSEFSIAATPLAPVVAMKETVAVEKMILTPVPAKPHPILKLEETRIIQLQEDVQQPVAMQKPPSPAPEKIPLSLSSAMLGSAVSDAAIDKLETEFAGAPEEPKAKPSEMFAPALKQDGAETDPLEDEAEDSAAALRASAVPAFGGLAKQPFAGIEASERGGKGLLIGGLVAAVAIGGLAAAWFYVPGFQKTMTWEYSRISERVHPQTKAISSAPQNHPAATPQTATPVPAVPSEPASSSASIDAPATAALSTTAAPITPAETSPAKPATAPAPVAATTTGPNKTAATLKNQPSTTPAATSPAAAAGSASLVNASATTLPGSASPKPTELFEVPEDYADDQVIHRVHPIYPQSARAKKLQGQVVLQAIIDKQGKVDSLQMVSGDPLLAQAAANAVKQWRYKPYSHNGDPVEFQTRITVDFKLPSL